MRTPPRLAQSVLPGTCQEGLEIMVREKVTSILFSRSMYPQFGLLLLVFSGERHHTRLGGLPGGPPSRSSLPRQVRIRVRPR